MKISIAMATYNGAKYLREQLYSFSSQSRLPDELVVSDDGSTDDTIKIVEEFALEAAFCVKVFRNKSHLGFANNFGNAINLCSGDLILLSDQDDVWFTKKIENVVQCFIDNLSAYVVVNDAEIADDTLKGTGLTVAGQLLSAGENVDQLLLGCCMSFRSELKPLFFPIPSNEMGHDSWINKLGIALQFRVHLPEVLQYYRRHQSNVSNASDSVMTKSHRVTRWHSIKQTLSRKDLQIDPVGACDRRLAELLVLKERLQIHANYLNALLAPSNIADKVIARLDAECNANEIRKSILRKRAVTRFLSALSFYCTGGYRLFGGWKSLAKDVLLPGRQS